MEAHIRLERFFRGPVIADIDGAFDSKFNPDHNFCVPMWRYQESVVFSSKGDSESPFSHAGGVVEGGTLVASVYNDDSERSFEPEAFCWRI
ncbi:hypothetical protein Tco_0600232, partial [Tanacetum coccineum]